MQKKSPAIYMTGTNVFIRGTTQFRAEPATFLFLFLFYDAVKSLWHTLVQPTTPCLVLKGNKKTLLFQFFIHQQPVLTHLWTSQHRHFL